MAVVQLGPGQSSLGSASLGMVRSQGSRIKVKGTEEARKDSEKSKHDVDPTENHGFS